MRAIISDVHSNLEALTAVLGDMRRFSVDSTYCLGDLIGFGPNPRECFDHVAAFGLALRGDHEHLLDPAIGHDTNGWSEQKRRMTEWTRNELFSASEDPQVASRRALVIGSLKPSQHDGANWHFHGSPADPLAGYVFPEDVHNAPKMRSFFACFGRLCFCGHSQIPGVISRTASSNQFDFHAASEETFAVNSLGHQVICNVGSVGQPRDGDPRACYVLFDGDVIRFRRVDYDVETTIQKIRQIPI
jgi:diadenosine tetraphosphatase ApaH/serine/threonine PP2A family protein phosphatase